jgi:hypothetical protein
LCVEVVRQSDGFAAEPRCAKVGCLVGSFRASETARWSFTPMLLRRRRCFVLHCNSDTIIRLSHSKSLAKYLVDSFSGALRLQLVKFALLMKTCTPLRRELDAPSPEVNGGTSARRSDFLKT